MTTHLRSFVLWVIVLRHNQETYMELPSHLARKLRIDPPKHREQLTPQQAKALGLAVDTLNARNDLWMLASSTNPWEVTFGTHRLNAKAVKGEMAPNELYPTVHSSAERLGFMALSLVSSAGTEEIMRVLDSQTPGWLELRDSTYALNGLLLSYDHAADAFVPTNHIVAGETLPLVTHIVDQLR